MTKRFGTTGKTWAAAAVLSALLFPVSALAAACTPTQQPPAGYTIKSATCVPSASQCSATGSDTATVDSASVQCQAAGQVCCVILSTQATPTQSTNVPFSISIPAKCLQTGTCSLDDIIATGISFANLLITLSGAIFFATFIYGGAMYLLSFGRSSWVQKGTKSMVGAMIGMGIVLAAWTIVRYVVTALLF